MSEGLSRRDFLKTAAAAAAAATAPISRKADARVQQAGTPAARAKVAIARSEALVSKDYKIDQEVANRMVDAAVKACTGPDTAADAYKGLFKPDDTVAIKINCAGGIRLSTRPHVVRVIVSALKGAGLEEKNIIVFDRSDQELTAAGFPVNDSGDGYRCYGNYHEGVGFSETEYEEGKVKTRISKIITERCSALINVPILKDHGGSGVTLAMKNHYGSIDNPGPYHDNNCDPYIAEISALPPIRSKTRLVIVDAIYCCYDGGPAYTPGRQWYDNSIWASTDFVAVDRIGGKVIDAKRKVKGLPTLADSGKPYKHVETAGRMGIGISDLDKIDVQELSVT
jgi:uncharacterized protein (DUF362 family)